MTSQSRPDRLRAFVDLLISSLDDDADGAAIAGRAFLSRFHFDRLVGAALGESPGAFRRRLLLERAAYELANGTATVTDVAMDAGYASLEAFERAFRRSFGTTPSAFRGASAPFRLPSPNGVHFHPPAGLLVPGDPTRRQTMDLMDRMLEHDRWLSERLIDAAGTLPDDDLDRVVRDREPLAFESDEPTVRGMLDRLVFTYDVWTAAVAGRAAVDDRDTSMDGLRRRLQASSGEFAEVIRGDPRPGRMGPRVRQHPARPAGDVHVRRDGGPRPHAPGRPAERAHRGARRARGAGARVRRPRRMGTRRPGPLGLIEDDEGRSRVAAPGAADPLTVAASRRPSRPRGP